jgi:hypothetical protein
VARDLTKREVEEIISHPKNHVNTRIIKEARKEIGRK